MRETFHIQTNNKMATKLFPGKNANIFVKKGYLEFKKKMNDQKMLKIRNCRIYVDNGGRYSNVPCRSNSMILILD